MRAGGLCESELQRLRALVEAARGRLAEIDRRMERAKSSEAKRVPHEEVMAEARRLVAAQSSAKAGRQSHGTMKPSAN